MLADPREITALLQQWQTGDQKPEVHLFELLMPELHEIARRCFCRERTDHDPQPGALVNEVFSRLTAARTTEWRDRRPFFALSARLMRRYLIDRARARLGVQFLTLKGLPERVLGEHTRLEMAVAVDLLLDELEKESSQRRAVVELKFFLGLTDQEAADALELTLHTLQREWHRARVWLYLQLKENPWKALPNATTA
jgi:RNA polymerase sigma-70 factor (ECF subfamily)